MSREHYANSPWSADALADLAEFASRVPKLESGAIANLLNQKYPDLPVTFTSDSVRGARNRRLKGRTTVYPTIERAVTGTRGDERDTATLISTDELLIRSGYDPKKFRVIESGGSSWQVQRRGGKDDIFRSDRIKVAPIEATDEEAVVDEEWLKNLRALAGQKREPVPPTISLPQRSSIIVAPIADWHLGLRVYPEEVGLHLPGYNKEIAEERYWKHLQAIADAPGDHDLLVWPDLGDMFHGSDLHPGDQGRVDLTIGQQFRLGLRLEVQGIEFLKQHYKKIIKVIMGGNHPRWGQKGVNGPWDNAELMMGWSLEEVFANDPQVQVFTHVTPSALYDINGLTVLFTHGDGIRNPGPDAVWKYVDTQAQLYRRLIDVMMFGHYHAPKFYSDGNRAAYMSGCYSGGDQYSVITLGGKQSIPQQWLFAFGQETISWQQSLELAPRPKPAIPHVIRLGVEDEVAA